MKIRNVDDILTNLVILDGWKNDIFDKMFDVSLNMLVVQYKFLQSWNALLTFQLNKFTIIQGNAAFLYRPWNQYTFVHLQIKYFQ